MALEAIAPSIGTVCDACDSALMESIRGVCKVEFFRTTVSYEGPDGNLGDVECATARRVDK
jgi:hypothetical protein